ncbi:DUF6562 domain-containing protein [Bacteroides sp.]|uniref:DUF6562 domain-containing protein n=1 Tax=Bacteroides sp. TaxID=29523 RepID=UPI002635D529|nr:DUF6562 domain-containing protein [Bacteroides sp.]
MKKSLLSLAMALCIGLFASCSQEEIISDTENGEQAVSLSAQLPDNISTRALPGAAEGHQLRCILEVWDKAENGKLITRIEKLGSEATDGKLQFTFTVPSATNYQCLLWADFITTPAPASRAADEPATYTDLFYSTTSLKAIDFNKKDASLFNNVSADAFCGVVDKNGTTSSLSVTLKRPFTKVTLTDNSDYLASCTSLAPKFMAPSKYDISTGKVAGYTEIAATGIEPKDKTLFSTFIFASADKAKLDKDIEIVFTKKDGGTETKTIKAGQISLDSNVENNAEANFSADNNVTVDVDINDKYPDPSAMAVGQYYYSDGTWSSAYNASKTAIGIIFHVGAGEGDDIAKYGDKAAEGSTIKGYVMALKSVGNGRNTQFSSLTDFTNLPAGDGSLTAFNGYANMQGISGSTGFEAANYPSIEAINDMTDAPATGTSGWYLPSYAQILQPLGMYYGFGEDIAIDETFKATVDAAITATIGDAFTADETNQNYLTSTLAVDKANLMAPQMKYTADANPLYSLAKATPATNKIVKGWVRPVLTIFEVPAAK